MHGTHGTSWSIGHVRMSIKLSETYVHFPIIVYFLRIQTGMFFFAGNSGFLLFTTKILRILFFITFISVSAPGKFVWSISVLSAEKKKRAKMVNIGSEGRLEKAPQVETRPQ